ncbi:MAG: HEAT repeat domain-containing protein [Thermogemmata sp.]
MTVWLVWQSSASGQWRWQDWFRLPRLEPARVRYWAEKLRSEKDPALRLEALRRLAEADPRVHADVLPALVAALRYDPSPALRQAAAETLGQFPVLFAQAGLALEEALEQDPVVAVQEAARQALWNYHLLGYRSSKGAGGFVGQTEEPPLAPQPAALHQTQALSPLPSTRRLVFPWASSLPPLLSPSSRSFWSYPLVSSEASSPSSPPAGTGGTPEPPLARTPPPPTWNIQLMEPPIRTVLREPPRLLQPPPIAAALPSIVPLPDQIFLPPLPNSSSPEPPLASPTPTPRQ